MPDLAPFDWDVLASRFEESCQALIAERGASAVRAARAAVGRDEMLEERPVPSSAV